MLKWVLFALALIACAESASHQLTRCQLVRELRKHGFPASQLRNWVCLVESESSRYTDIVSKPNSNGSRDYGLFQINDRYWCSNTNKPGKDCNVTCAALLTKDITKSAQCAKKIYSRHNFNAWYGWINKCKNKPLPDISKCSLALVACVESASHQLTRCQLVSELRKNSFPAAQLRDWVCLVEHESSRYTDIVGKLNSDGSRDYGLFQINDRYWCSNTTQPGKDCNVTCADLLTNDITKSAQCAKKIFSRQSFNAWYGWIYNCKNKPLPDISQCLKVNLYFEMEKWLFVALALIACVESAKHQLTRCELVEALRDHEFPEEKMRDWVCLVEKESSRCTDMLGKVNKNGSRDYGLFQINDKYWCSNTTQPGKDCNVTCAELLTDDITKSATCAKKIFKRHNFNAWYGWRNHCKNKTLPDISNC
ncbi:uncharacterized protein LOC113239129 [Hyposmocoma kahamanoa]|uniref:uncharacterized protein LOC113239129 n=1 Tax=Hyposmocoma kahamanoa TaxID=1477025 RepID=UPI000E6D912F|nr:uncharacterized protein LOC113239129 [Hyposmocoma kahamanoa]